MQWVHLQPQGGEKKLGVIYRECTPRTRSALSRQSKSQFLGHFLLGGLDLEVYLIFLDRLLRATTKKGQLFDEEKCSAADKILATPLRKSELYNAVVVLLPAETRHVQLANVESNYAQLVPGWQINGTDARVCAA